MYQFYNSHPTFLSQSDVSIHVDRFVRNVLRSFKPAFEIQANGARPYRMLKLGRDLQYLRQMVDLFDGRYDYDFSENLSLFSDACHAIRLENAGGRFVCPCPNHYGFLSEPECLNLLVDRIRSMGKRFEYCRKPTDRRYQAKQLADAVRLHTDGLFERCARILVIRVNLYYRQAARLRLRVEDVFEDMNRLARARQIDRLFEHAIDYTLRVEQGEDQGFHIHAAFIFNGSKVRRQFCVAKLIGELWVRITNGRGYCHDSGLEWEKREGDPAERGTGMFHRNDLVGREAVCELMIYLTKDTQYLRVKPMGAKAYRTGRRFVAPYR